MKVSELISKTGFKAYGSEQSFEKELSGVFVGDLLSWVMGNAEVDQAWITVQSHLNIVAVAALKEIACLVIVQGAEVPADTIQKAIEEDIAILTCDLSSYNTCCLVHELGL